MRTQWIVGLLVGALVVGFVGGIVGRFLLPASGDLGDLPDRVARVESGQKELETRVTEITPSGAGLRVGVVNAEDLFNKVFLPQVQTERAALEGKTKDIQALQADYAAGKITTEVYQQRYLRLQAELLEATLAVNLAMLDKMIASPGFLNLRSDLQNLRTEASPVETEVQNVVKEVQVAILDPTGFAGRLQQLQTALQQLETLLVQVSALKIVEISQQIAKEQGYDLVLRTRDVIVFRREGAVVDLSSEVEGRLWRLFSS